MIMEKKMNASKLLVIFVIFFISNFAIGGTPITITMESITFDSGSKFTPGDGTPNENINFSEYFCYHLSEVNTLSNDIILRLKTNCPDQIMLIITAKQGFSENGFGNISYFNNSCSISTVYGTTFLLTPDGTVPTTISKHDFNWEWTITAIPTCNTSQYDACTFTFQTHHCCYVLWDDPKAPMEEPWLNVLDKAVELTGSSYEYEDQVIASITTNLYNSGLNYNSNQTHYDTDDEDTCFFHLNAILDEWSYVDCQDCSMLLTCLASSLGTSLCQILRINPLNATTFYTKLIDPIGSTSWQNVSWSFHQVAWKSGVYDPTAMLKRYNQTQPYLPLEESASSYSANLTGNTIEFAAPFRLGELDPFYDKQTKID